MKWKSWRLLIWFGPLWSLIAGCTMVGPNYQAPKLGEIHGRQWQERENTGSKTRLTANEPVTAWWRQFNDPILSELVEGVVAHNQDLAKARERLVEAALKRRLAGADRYPRVDLDGEVMRSGTGDKALNPQGPPPGEEMSLYSAGGFAGWELDLWGRIARNIEAATREYEAELEIYRYLAVSLTAEVALAYVDVRILEQRYEAYEENVQLLTSSLELVELRYTTGTSTELDVKQLKRQLHRTLALGPELLRAKAVARNRIAILLGRAPADHGLDAGPLLEVPPMVGLGVPADLITRRADVRSSERQYAAAVAAIGSAEALKYPRLTLVGSLYFQTDDLGDLLDPDAIIYSLGPRLSFPLFNGGRLQTGVDIRDSRAEQARLELEKTLLVALKEVEDGIAGVSYNQERVASLVAAKDDAGRAVELADQLYRTGLGSLFQLLDAQREFIDARDELLQARQFELAEIVRLYRALGGGWDVLAGEMTAGQLETRGS